MASMNSIMQIPKTSILANWFVITLVIGFFFIGTVPKILGLSDESLAIEFRILVLLFSLFILFTEIFLIQRSFINFRIYKFFLFFWIIYSLRIIFDLYLFPIQLYEDNKAAYYFQFAFGVCLVPSLALIIILRRYQLNFDYIYNWTYGLLYFSLMTLIYFRLTSGLVGRTVGDINIGVQSVGVFGAILCLFSIYNLTARKLIFLYTFISIFGIVVGFSGVIISASKTPFISLIIVIILFISFWYGRVKSILILAFFGIISSFLLFNVIDYFSNYFDSVFLLRLLYTLEIGGDTARDLLWNAALGEFLQNPLIGNAFLIQEDGYAGSFPHSIIIEAFMATGIVGGSLFLIFILKCLNYSIKLIKNKSTYTWLSLLYIQNFFFVMVSDNLYSNDSFWSFSILITGVYFFYNKELKV